MVDPMERPVVPLLTDALSPSSGGVVSDKLLDREDRWLGEAWLPEGAQVASFAKL